MSTYSILRTKEDQELAKLYLTGRVLDLGGHKNSSYFSLINTEKQIEIANFDERNPGTHKTSSGATHIFDFEEPFPLSDVSFEHVLCINVLEHIYNFHNVLSETARILKKNGGLYISVPFFYNIHGSPNDYFRYTKSALEKLLKAHGFTDIIIIELGDGPCSAVFQTFGGSIPTNFLRLFFKNVAMAVDQIFSRLSIRYASIKQRVPLGYFISATKE